ncbi:MAG: tripartite tricarboxylate transporter substrate binding protein [Burkholderiaceae bacterium]|nr:tripartite tricarboxylate transporter substrate binding protein [Burkholderiaceae bacterium]
MKKMLKTLMTLTLTLGVAGAALAQDAWPSRPLKLVVPTAAGGANDVVARILAEALQAELRQPVVVENRVGASGTIGAAFVAKAPADGYTLLFGTGSTHVIAPAMMKGVPYDPIKDFTPIGIVGPAPFVVFVRASLPAKTLPEFVALAKAKPGQMSIGTTGPAAVYELAALTLEAQGGVQLNHVPYKGFAPMLLDVMGDRLDIGVGPIDGSIKTDKIRILAVMGQKRSRFLPDVPASAEQGYPNFTVPAWAAVWATGGVPTPVAERLVGAMRAAMSRKDVQERIAISGIVPEVKDDKALRQLMTEELDNVRSMMRRARIELQ